MEVNVCSLEVPFLAKVFVTMKAAVRFRDTNALPSADLQSCRLRPVLSFSKIASHSRLRLLRPIRRSLAFSLISYH